MRDSQRQLDDEIRPEAAVCAAFGTQKGYLRKLCRDDGYEPSRPFGPTRPLYYEMAKVRAAIRRKAESAGPVDSTAETLLKKRRAARERPATTIERGSEEPTL